jgi:hypothetical protein
MTKALAPDLDPVRLFFAQIRDYLRQADPAQTLFQSLLGLI